MNEKLFSIRGFKNQKLISKIKSKTGLTYFPSYTLAWAPSPIFGPINSCLGSTSHLESKLKSPTEWTSLPDPILLFFFFSLEKMCNYLASSSNTHIHTLSITHVEAYQPTKEKDPSFTGNELWKSVTWQQGRKLYPLVSLTREKRLDFCTLQRQLSQHIHTTLSPK